MNKSAELLKCADTKPELEKKFLVKEIPSQIHLQLSTVTPTIIEQYYLPNKGPRLRKQINPDGSVKYFITSKEKVEGTQGVAKLETEAEIEADAYNQLLKDYPPNKSGKIIRKKRYQLEIDGVPMQIDCFTHQLEGNILIEIEFPNLTSAYSFRPPNWFGREVTSEISNRKLARGVPFPT